MLSLSYTIHLSLSAHPHHCHPGLRPCHCSLGLLSLLPASRSLIHPSYSHQCILSKSENPSIAFPYLKFTARRGKKKSSAYHGSVVLEPHCASESPGGLLKHSTGPQLECSSLFHIFLLIPDPIISVTPSPSLCLHPHSTSPPPHHHHHPHTLSACYGAFH